MSGTALSVGQFAEFSGAVLKALPRNIDPDVALNWARNGEALGRALEQALCSSQKRAPLSLIGTTELGEIAGKKTSDCMTAKRWYYRDGDLDKWLPAMQPGQPEGVVSAYQLGEAMTFREMAAQAAQIPVGASLDRLAAGLRERGHVLTLPDIEKMVEKQEAGEDVGLRTDGYAHFAFVEDASECVSVAGFHRHGGGWCVDVGRLDFDSRRYAGHRLLLRNSVAATL